MTVHEQFADDLALYALGCLPAGERAGLEEHLRDCSACRRELERLRGDMALMAMATSGPKPPVRARQRLMDAISREPRREKARAGLWWWPVVRWAVVALVLAGLILSWRRVGNLEQQIARLQRQLSDQQLQLQRARDVEGTLTATDAMRVTLVAAKTPPQPQGKAIYLKDRSSLIFMASNLPNLAPQKAYELWLIPTKGNPIPAGVFRPDAHGSATVINPPLPTGVEAKTFAITVEPEQGSATPTMPIVMIGSGA